MNKESGARSMILGSERNFQNRGPTAHSARRGRPRSSDQRTTRGEDLFQETTTLSIGAAERQLNIPRSSIQRILRQRV